MTEQNTPLLTSDAETRMLIQKLLLQVATGKTEAAAKLKDKNLGENFLPSVLETIELTLGTLHGSKPNKTRRANICKAVDDYLAAEDEAGTENPTRLSKEKSSRYKWFLELGV